MSLSQRPVLTGVDPLLNEKWLKIWTTATGMTRADVHTFWKVQEDVANAQVAVVIGTAALRTCHLFTRPQPFLWRFKGHLKYTYVPPVNKLYNDTLFMTTAVDFYKELAREYPL